ncbi:hypothetical protein [Tsukamurella pseudospumae]|uniref:Uncharacterized protein n=1 Tax=Tsukamurella pseudospumae TaxID=239498 RepID=A0A138A0E5_9ACTN|nr:hypothetical protein [Tsukamurella pseudospumae]KXO88976.1 hypothetical protein AXK61_10050 [Tsukamurella pseudospumae]KXP03913.1 hypothetical protein AXK60_19345 [Tsukamurella pseudospumae]
MFEQTRGGRCRALWFAVHADKVLTNAYIVYALTVAPIVLVFTDDPQVHRLMWWSLILGAIALALLGIVMAVGMSLLVSRGDSLEFDWFLSQFDPTVRVPGGSRPDRYRNGG